MMKLYVSGIGVMIGMVCLIGLGVLGHALAQGTGRRVVVSACAAVIGFAVLYWDAAITSVQMYKLCPTAGIALNRSVHADGYLTSYGGADQLSPGFTLVEVQNDFQARIYEKVGGEVRKTVIDTRTTPYVPRSRYELVSGRNVAWRGVANISIKRSEVRDRESGEVLGTATTYTAYPGWLDRNTVGLIGQIIWTCPAQPSVPSELLRMAVLPNP
jgi:hypothetical protein